MNTANVLIEIIIIGYTSFIWIIMILIFSFKIPLDAILTKLTDYDIIISIFLTAFAYFIGWFIDHISYWLLYYIFKIGKNIKRMNIPDNNFIKEYILVYQEMKSEINRELSLDVSIIRFTRSCFLNFLIISAISLLMNLPFYIFISSSILLLFCLIILISRWNHWFLKIRILYEILNKNEIITTSNKNEKNKNKKKMYLIGVAISILGIITMIIISFTLNDRLGYIVNMGSFILSIIGLLIIISNYCYHNEIKF